MKDCVVRKKSDVDNKQRQVIDSKKLMEAPYECQPDLLAQLGKIYDDNVKDQSKAKPVDVEMPAVSGSQAVPVDEPIKPVRQDSDLSDIRKQIQPEGLLSQIRSHLNSKPKRDWSSSQPQSALKNKESVPRLSKVRFAENVKKGASSPDQPAGNNGKQSRLTNILDFNDL